ILDHSATSLPATSGNDSIAGGADHDVIFGQLGNDNIQGDGSIDIDVLTTGASVEATTDGDDYVEGNGGADLIFGNLGQDDILGGSSDLFGLTTATQRPDDADTIYGGAGTDISRNNPGDATVGTGQVMTLLPNGHSRDADMILGDNGQIFRLRNGSGGFLQFTYDQDSAAENRGTLRIIPRAAAFLDYTPGTPGPADIGAADVIHGESGDDFIYGLRGSDILFGEGQDDDLVGGYGFDRIYGGTGEDGILGDDGRIFTSRNGSTETLNGLTVANLEQESAKSGPFTGAVIFITGRLLKSADLTPYEIGENDSLYGGWGDDFIHGGAGDDAISGAEALAEFYNSTQPANPNPLGYDAVTRKFARYDANVPRTKLTGFLLNFEASDAQGSKINDGKDLLLGGTGHDWLVGGTLNDRLFGGLGDDLLNADDNHDNGTTPGLNNRPDNTLFADADFAFGGNGLDVLIANTGGDRLFDWQGEFNSYFVPFAAFGEPTVVRNSSPSVVQFLRDLGAESGADGTRTEPDGELGLGDGDTGSSRDPQPGTVPGPRDTQGAPEDDSIEGP
ncbi:MAG: hypothetical protein L0Z50_24930, partial [Verrucomicrobiales bacterium]|nr:hypothetical protein [Verrucomicrobiales bacterium]